MTPSFFLISPSHFFPRLHPSSLLSALSFSLLPPQSLTLSSADTSCFQHHPPCPQVLPFLRSSLLPSLTLSLHPNLVQEGRLQVEELRHDVECKEVAVDPLSTHRCLQKSLVLIHRQAEQGEALWVLGFPGRSHRPWKNRKWAYCWGLAHPWPQPNLQHPCKAEIATLFYRGETGSERGSHLPRGTQQGRPESDGFPGLSDSAATPSMEPHRVRGARTEVPGGF